MRFHRKRRALVALALMLLAFAGGIGARGLTADHSTVAITAGTTDTTAAAPVGVGPAALVGSSVNAGETLPGTVDWTVTTSGDVVAVEFWMDGRRLDTETSPPFVFHFDTTRAANGPHQLGLALVQSNGTRVTPQIGTVTISNGSGAAPASGGDPPGPFSETLDWETGNSAGATDLECPSAASDFSVSTSIVRQGRYAAHMHLDSNSRDWSNGNPRCLATLDSGETTNDDYYYGFSIYEPAHFTALVWELHQPASIWSLSPACAVAPFALHAEHLGSLNGLFFRIATGDCNGNSSAFAYQDLNIPLPHLDHEPTGTWIDFVVHIRFEESAAGVVQVWDRVGSDPYVLDLDRSGIPTMPFSSGSNVHNVALYTEMGLYASAGWSGDVYVDDLHRGSSFAAVAP